MGRIGGSCVLLGSHKILGLVTGGSLCTLRCCTLRCSLRRVSFCIAAAGKDFVCR